MSELYLNTLINSLTPNNCVPIFTRIFKECDFNDPRIISQILRHMINYGCPEDILNFLHVLKNHDKVFYVARELSEIIFRNPGDPLIIDTLGLMLIHFPKLKEKKSLVWIVLCEKHVWHPAYNPFYYHYNRRAREYIKSDCGIAMANIFITAMADYDRHIRDYLVYAAIPPMLWIPQKLEAEHMLILKKIKIEDAKIPLLYNLFVGTAFTVFTGHAV